MDFKTLIKSRLKQHGKTVIELCDYLSMTDSNYYTSMKKGSWNIRQLQKMATFFDCEIWELLHEAKVENTQPSLSKVERGYNKECTTCEVLKDQVKYLKEQNTQLLNIVEKSKKALELKEKGEDTG